MTLEKISNSQIWNLSRIIKSNYENALGIKKAFYFSQDISALSITEDQGINYYTSMNGWLDTIASISQMAMILKL